MLELNVCCVLLSVSVIHVFCGSVLLIVIIFSQITVRYYRYNMKIETLTIIEKTSYVLSSENWEDNFDTLLH